MKKIILLMLLALATTANAQNTTYSSFSKAKKDLLQHVYYDHKETIYCGAAFDNKKNVDLPSGFHTTKHIKRSKKVEWEHIVPAQNFGQTFVEWREGAPTCVDSKGKKFKGRNCASKVNQEYRYMQSDLYNLAPAIGAVNAMRSNYNFTMLPGSKADFGTCDMRIDSRKAQPPEQSRGRIARTYKYMEETYPRYSMSKSQRQLMDSWDKMYPVSEWECVRAKRIEKLQGNRNSFVTDRCDGSNVTSLPVAQTSAVIEEDTEKSDQTFHGNTKSKVYHSSSCRYYECKNCTEVFNSRQEAEDAGYREHEGE